ncbi:calcium-binding protein, partial [Massilia sp. Root335]|uniref:calcium-binding protein n=1 Tax=Massilia sp. Root335 TaxID=1736517 RepID=UPI0027D89625
SGGDPADMLQFGTGIAADTTQLNRSGNDLTFNLGASDRVTIKDYFNPAWTSNYRIETVAFADGTTWDIGTTIGKLTYNGTAGADTMPGDSTYGNRVNGLDGNDSITGGNVADVLDGGAGNDTIYGGSGNDTITGGTG